MKDRKVIYISNSTTSVKNRTLFQRPLYLCKNYHTYIFCRDFIGKEIRKKAKIAKTCPIRCFPFNLILFPIWAFFNTLIYGKRGDIVYTTHERWPVIISFFLKKMGFLWIVDFLDDPILSVKYFEGKTGIKKKLQYFVANLIYLIAKRCLQQGDLFISLYPPGYLKRNYTVDEEKVFRVTNGVDLSIVKPMIKNQKQEMFKIVYVGRLAKERGLGLIIQVAEVLKGLIPAYRFLLIGNIDKEDKKLLIKVIKQKRLDGYIEQLRELDHRQVLKIIANSSICICPFLKTELLDYAFPVKIFEYMAMGKAVVATRLKGICQIIKDGENGLLVEPGNFQEMAEAIKKLYYDTNLKEKIEKNALKSVQKYDWKIINSCIGQKINQFILNH